MSRGVDERGGSLPVTRTEEDPHEDLVGDVA